METSPVKDSEQNKDEDDKDLVNPLDMSDSDFDKLNFDDLDTSTEEVSTIDKEAVSDSATDTDNINEDANDDNPRTDKESAAGESEDDASGETDKPADQGESRDDESGSGSESSNSAEGETEKGETENSSGDIERVSEKASVDYKAEHAKLLAPFRANNKDMQVENVEDARTLMQMGANYNKKMAGLKPNLKLIKMLQNNDLLDEAKLSFLIDLDKKNPEAIKKFLQDSNINPVDIDLESDNEYKSNTYTVNDKDIALDGILEEIKDTESFSETIDIISNKWDESSKQILLDQPNVIKTINEHVQSGVYAKISTAVEHKRMLGALLGVSDLEAYQQVGNEINAAGGFDKPKTPNNNISTNTKVEKTSANEAVDSKLRSRKKAASSTKTTVGSTGENNFNPLSMSDEEFEAAGASKFL